MNQRVTARIVGGKRFTTAEYREYFNASRILRDQANRLGTSRRSFIAAGYELKIHPSRHTAPVRFDRGKSTVYGAGPYRIAVPAAARTLRSACRGPAIHGSQLNELSSLIAQAQSLYAQAEEASRKGLNICCEAFHVITGIRDSRLDRQRTDGGKTQLRQRWGNSTNSILWNPPHGCRKAS